MTQEKAGGTDERSFVSEDFLQLESVLIANPSPPSVSFALAGLFQVQSSEVALLRLEREALRFLYPDHLRNTGAIPISSSAIAAHTALSKKAEAFNNFARIKHASIFEIIPSTHDETGEKIIPTPIQKLMSAPVLDRQTRQTLGVIQISHKATETRFAADFTREELHALELAAEMVAIAQFFRNPEQSHQSLEVLSDVLVFVPGR